MHCTVNAGELAAALRVVHPAVARRITLPILTHVLLDARDDRLTLSATNLEISLRTLIAAEVTEPGRTTVSEAKLSMWAGLQGRESTVTLKGDAKNLTLLSGRDRVRIGAIDADDSPPLPEVDAEPINVSAALLDRALTLTLGSVAKENSRPVLFGALMTFKDDALEMAGADGFTLGFARVDLAAPVTETTALIVPGKSLATLAGLLGDVGLVEISASQRGVAFVVGPITLFSRLIDGTFPDYRRVAPTEAKSVTVANTDALELQIRSAQIVDKTTPVRFRSDPKAGTLTVWARDVDTEHEGVIDAEVTGEALQFALRCDQALMAIKALASKTVEIRSNGPATPVLITIPDASDVAWQVLMPTHVDDLNRAIRDEVAA